MTLFRNYLGNKKKQSYQLPIFVTNLTRKTFEKRSKK